MVRISIWWVLLWFLASCAQYETTVTYTPPPTQEGKSCVAQCQTMRVMCDNGCRMERRLCEREEELEARARYEEARRDYARYEEDERGYKRCLNNSPDSAWQGSYKSLKAYCSDRFDWDKGRGKLSEPSPYAYSGDTWRCQGDCGCEQDYDACYQSCGGRVHRVTRCVANCQ